jgi:hypothetical protein
MNDILFVSVTRTLFVFVKHDLKGVLKYRSRHLDLPASSHPRRDRPSAKQESIVMQLNVCHVSGREGWKRVKEKIRDQDDLAGS